MDAGKFSMQAMAKALEQELACALSSRLVGVLRQVFDGYAGQFRSSRNPQHRVPFIVHPVGVAKLAIKHYSIARNLPDDLETVACVALAHDLLEDTRMSSSRLEEEDGSKVREYVEALTKPPAEVAGRTVEERNQELLRKILRAGPTAVFVKICDSMHNLGSPAFTPIALLAKTVEKAKSQYLPLLDNCPLGESFRALYLGAIDNAQKTLAEELKFVRAAPTVLTVADAIRECVAASAGKVLEVHDITTILKHIGGAESVGCWRLKSMVDGKFEPVAGMGPDVRTLHWPASDLVGSAQVLGGVAAQRLGASFCVKKPEVVISVPFRTDADASFVIALGFGSKFQPKWMDKDTASLLAQFLAHRLILSEADRRGRLATEAANLGLQLRTEVAARVGVQPSQLLELQRWRSRCEQAVVVVSHAVRLIIMSGSHSIPLAREINVESRVKTIDSIMLKMLNTHTEWPNYESLEDIAGVRVICPTQVGVSQLERALLSPSTGLLLHPSIPQPRRDYVADPTSEGYRALHLILAVETRFGEVGQLTVPCELQLRTMFQDTWAKISHALAYQGGPALKRQAEQLRNLSNVLRSYEQNSGGPEDL